jgi:hypothetical protein
MPTSQPQDNQPLSLENIEVPALPHMGRQPQKCQPISLENVEVPALAHTGSQL